MSCKDMDQQLFEQLTLYCNTSDNHEDNLHRAELLGFGGRNVLVGADTNPVTTLAFMGISRVRIVAQEQLIPGDIIVVNENADAFDASAWLYMDGQLLDLQTGETTSAEPMLSQLISRNYFAVIRPSLGM